MGLPHQKDQGLESSLGGGKGKSFNRTAGKGNHLISGREGNQGEMRFLEESRKSLGASAKKRRSPGGVHWFEGKWGKNEQRREASEESESPERSGNVGETSWPLTPPEIGGTGGRPPEKRRESGTSSRSVNVGVSAKETRTAPQGGKGKSQSCSGRAVAPERL